MRRFRGDLDELADEGARGVCLELAAGGRRSANWRSDRERDLEGALEQRSAVYDAYECVEQRGAADDAAGLRMFYLLSSCLCL